MRSAKGEATGMPEKPKGACEAAGVQQKLCACGGCAMGVCKLAGSTCIGVPILLVRSAKRSALVKHCLMACMISSMALSVALSTAACVELARRVGLGSICACTVSLAVATCLWE